MTCAALGPGACSSAVPQRAPHARVALLRQRAPQELQGAEQLVGVHAGVLVDHEALHLRDVKGGDGQKLTDISWKMMEIS